MFLTAWTQVRADLCGIILSERAQADITTQTSKMHHFELWKDNGSPSDNATDAHKLIEMILAEVT
jgi:hypothetical protein